MSVKYLLPYCVLFVFLACKSNERTVEITVPSLAVSDIYRADTVVVFLKNVDDDGRKLGKSYLEKAREAREKNPEKAIYYYKRSLCVNPAKEVYMEFSEALEEMKNYRELEKVHETLFTWDYQAESYPMGKPEFGTYIDYVVNFTRTGNPYYYHTLWHIEKLEFTRKDIREALLKDERIPFNKDSKAFRLLEMNFMEEEEYEAYIKSPEYLEFFIHSFETVADNWSVDESTITEFNYHRDEQYYAGEGSRYEADFSSVLPCGEGNAYQLGCRLLTNSSHIALIYSVDTSSTACPKDMRMVTHYLAVYDTNYQLLTCTPIAWQNGSELVTATVKGITVTQTRHRRVWEKPFKKEDFDNRLLVNQFVETETLYIDEFSFHEKKIIEQEESTDL